MARPKEQIGGAHKLPQHTDIQWKIWYGDGSIFSNKDGKPEEAPSGDIQIIVVKDEVTIRGFLQGFDYYWFEGGFWSGGDIFGLYDYLLREQKVKFGRMIPNTIVFHKLLEKAQADDCFPGGPGAHRLNK